MRDLVIHLDEKCSSLPNKNAIDELQIGCERNKLDIKEVEMLLKHQSYTLNENTRIISDLTPKVRITIFSISF